MENNTEQPFSKRIRYNSHLYRNRDRLMKSEQNDELLQSGSSNAAQHEQSSDTHLTHDAVQNENTETLEYGDEADEHDEFDNAADEGHVFDYLIESSDEEHEGDPHEGFSVQDALRRWAISKNQTYESIEEVMGIIRRVSNCKLPKDARTLLKINRNPAAEILTVNGGQYWYHGIQKCFSNELR
uniref:Uncharacterized protein n=1 Tax=Anopheles maculatus TaxID=74869 RepID=A0A182SY97_9DIPT